MEQQKALTPTSRPDPIGDAARSSKKGIVLVMLAFGVLGSLSFFALSAGTRHFGFEPERAQLAGGAATCTDSSASSGEFVALKGGCNPATPTSTPAPTATANPTPAPATPTPTPAPDASTWHGYEKPGPSNTGPTGSLSASGSITITDSWISSSNGGSRTIEGKDISGVITVRASNITIRNFRINAGGGTYGINANNGNTGVVIEDGEIYNFDSAAILGGNFTARRLNIHESNNDGIKPYSNVVIESSWIHHLGKEAGSHADAVQMVTGGNNVFKGNYCDMPYTIPAPYKANACFIIQSDNGPIDNVTIEHNWLNGGNYTIFVRDKGKGHGAPTNVRILSNRFGRDYQYGLFSTEGSPTISGSVWDDSGEAIPGR